MSKFTLTIDTDNAAFGDDTTETAWEVACCLQREIAKLREGHVRGDVFDTNGNRVGEWTIELPHDALADVLEDAGATPEQEAAQLDDTQRARYDEAQSCGATHNDAMEAALCY